MLSSFHLYDINLTPLPPSVTLTPTVLSLFQLVNWLPVSIVILGATLSIDKGLCVEVEFATLSAACIHKFVPAGILLGTEIE